MLFFNSENTFVLLCVKFYFHITPASLNIVHSNPDIQTLNPINRDN